MAKFLYVIEGDAPSTASPSFATGDQTLVKAALEAIFERLSAPDARTVKALLS